MSPYVTQDSSPKTDYIQADSEILEKIMLEKEPFLDAQLTLSKLSQSTKIPSYRLSKVLKQKESNFFDYINGYRIEKVKSLLREGKSQELSMLGIAMVI